MPFDTSSSVFISNWCAIAKAIDIDISQQMPFLFVLSAERKRLPLTYLDDDYIQPIERFRSQNKEI